MNSQFKKESIMAQWIIAICIIVGFFLSSVLYSLQAASLAQGFSIAITTLTVAGAALLVGGLLGFLFGIPKKFQQDSAAISNPQGNSVQDANNRNSAYQENTNLEQISDWLTKILVGVGLTQLARIPSALQSYADFTASGLGNFSSSKVFAVALLLYFLICGFLITYLWTRLYLAGVFGQADRDAMGGIVKKVSDIEADAKALIIIQRQLKPTTNSQLITQGKLEKIIGSASVSGREQIFQQACNIFGGDFENPRMESTIPVFRALITNDPKNYLYHGWLGFAMKVARDMDWKEAETELTAAIQLRDSKNYDVWIETNRADVRINHDANFLQGKQSTDEFKNIVLADLKVAAGDPNIQSYTKIAEWLKLNDPQSDLLSNF